MVIVMMCWVVRWNEMILNVMRFVFIVFVDVVKR